MYIHIKFSLKGSTNSANFGFHGHRVIKGQLILKANCQAEDSSQKRTNEFVFTGMRCVFVRFFWKNPRPEKNVSRLSDL